MTHVLDALRGRAEDETKAARACFRLWHLAMEAGQRKALLSSSPVPLLASVLGHHPLSASVAAAVCAALAAVMFEPHGEEESPIPPPAAPCFQKSVLVGVVGPEAARRPICALSMLPPTTGLPARCECPLASLAHALSACSGAAPAFTAEAAVCGRLCAIIRADSRCCRHSQRCALATLCRLAAHPDVVNPLASAGGAASVLHLLLSVTLWSHWRGVRCCACPPRMPAGLRTPEGCRLYHSRAGGR